MIVFPKAKINIGLRITKKRIDGYHDIQTIFYPVNLCDALEFVVNEDHKNNDNLTVTGIDTGSRAEDNLVMQTLKILRLKYTFPFLKIHLHKVIPIGAGLGGGSSDAAFFLKIVNQCFGLSINDPELKTIAMKLGSDCPFFIKGVPAFATGKGEILSPIKPVLSGYYLTLLNPGVRINTREAYQNSTPEFPSTSLIQLIDHPVTKWKGLILNDFEEFAFRKHPVIAEIKNELYDSGALFSLMSGSGSSVYGIFPQKPLLPDNLKDFVIWEGVL